MPYFVRTQTRANGTQQYRHPQPDGAPRVWVQGSVPMYPTTSASCIRAHTAMPANCRQAPFWSWGAARPAFKSPRILHQSGRQVYVCMGRHRHPGALPRARHLVGGRVRTVQAPARGVAGNPQPGPVSPASMELRGRLAAVGFKGNGFAGPVKPSRGLRLAMSSSLEAKPRQRGGVAGQLQEISTKLRYVAENKWNLGQIPQAGRQRSSTETLELDLRATEELLDIIWATGFRQ